MAFRVDFLREISVREDMYLLVRVLQTVNRVSVCVRVCVRMCVEGY